MCKGRVEVAKTAHHQIQSLQQQVIEGEVPVTLNHEVREVNYRFTQQQYKEQWQCIKCLLRFLTHMYLHVVQKCMVHNVETLEMVMICNLV